MANVAQTILQQLGGNKFVAMTGAKDLIDRESGISMRLPRGAANKATHFFVELSGNDTYSVTFRRWIKRDLEMRDIKTLDNVYADQLTTVFESETGFLTRL